MFLNDRSILEQESLTSQLRHQILPRRTARNPPPDAVPGLDAQPLREHAWLDSLADVDVVVADDFTTVLTVMSALLIPLLLI